MPRIIVDPIKPFDISLRIFKRACEKAGIKQELRDSQHYVKPTQKRTIAKKADISKAKKEA
ncbi:30S ribosomal protein S21 [Francisella tularensis subsp. holarctica]|uniref:30S ribosomal protein S21 n=1 Tax=Francisella tularensis TaxID=263 RepID=UPI002381CCCC|nr:30S ribosomal protein S21 [Francisella tularensis]MDE4982428.1 30S ribosomal protein S21 [Francisella tularensis subsp. holarctica]